MQVDFLLVGQGIGGTFLSWYLQKAGYSFIIVDNASPGAASKVAAGIINPVTGRRIVKTWLIDEVMPFAWQAYQQLEQELAINCINQKNIIDFFPTVQMKEAFAQRYTEDSQYLSPATDANTWREFFNYDFDYGIIDPCFLVHLQTLLPAYRNQLISRQQLMEETFDLNGLIIQDDGILYKDIKASYLVFCDGIASFKNPWFTPLPFAPNKGEVLWIEVQGMPASNIFKKGINLVPWSEDVYWAGSSYEWDFEHENPTEDFRERMLSVLQHWLKVPVKLLDHKAAIRPATIERRPFIGFHPLYPSLGIFNGMGTKGCSLSPWFASQFVKHIKNKTPIHPEADVKRFRRILEKGNKR